MSTIKRYLLILLAVVASLGGMSLITFAHHDQYRHLVDKNPGFNRCSLDRQYNGLIHDLGRPIQGWIECTISQVVRERQDFTILRWLGLILLSLFACRIFRWQTTRCDWNEYQAAFASLGISVLPGFINLVMMANLPNLLAGLFGLRSYEVWDKEMKKLPRWSWGLTRAALWSLAALFTYPACAFSFWILSISLGFSLQRDRFMRILLDLCFWVGTVLLYLGFIKGILHPLVHYQPAPTSPYAFVFSFDLAAKADLFKEMAAATINLWNIYPDFWPTLLMASLITITIAIGLGRDRSEAAYVGLTFVVLLFSLSPILLSRFDMFLYRTTTTAGAMIVILIAQSVRDRWILASVTIVALGLGAFNSLMSARNSSREFEILSKALTGKEVSAVTILGPDGIKSRARGVNGLPYRTDEFNVNTSSFSAEELSWVVLASLREVSHLKRPVRPCQTDLKTCESGDGAVLVFKNPAIPVGIIVDLK